MNQASKEAFLIGENMARATSKTYPKKSMKDLKNPLVFVIDMNNGFTREGALADPEIEKIAAPILELLENTQAPSVFICDHHAPDAKEFSSFPPHCLEDSEEAEIIESLKPFAKNIVRKNSINAFLADEFQPWKEQLEDRDLVVTGCCSDLCVLQFALALQSYLNEKNLEANVIVPADCIDTYDIESVHPVGIWNDFSLENMKANGIEVISSFGEEE